MIIKLLRFYSRLFYKPKCYNRKYWKKINFKTVYPEKNYTFNEISEYIHKQLKNQ